LVKNIQGVGYKEASHSLRNIGYTERLKALTKRKYLEIEGLLRRVARKSNLNLAE